MANILFISGYKLKPIQYEALSNIKQRGHKIYLLIDDFFQETSDIFEKVFQHDVKKTKEVLFYLKQQNIAFDVVETQSDFLTPLAALIRKEYGIIGNSPLTAFYCRSKYHMRKKLKEQNVPVPQFRLCKNYNDIKKAIDEIGIPFVIKPIGANTSYGVFAVMNKSDLENIQTLYEKSIGFLKSEDGSYDVFAYDKEELRMMGIDDFVNMQTDYLVEEFMDGPEVSIDALVQNGKVTIFGIEDQIRMKPPNFMQIAGKVPFICSSKKYQSIEEIVTKTVHALGIENSATHTEIIFTKDGPKVVEIGCRIGGDDLIGTIAHVTGYNLLYELILILLGEPRTYGKIKPLCHCFSEFILPQKKGIIRKIEIPDMVRNDPDVFDIKMYLEAGDAVALLPEAFDYIGYISAKGETPEAAQKKLRESKKQIKITIDE